MKIVKCAHCSGKGKCKTGCATCGQFPNFRGEQQASSNNQVVCSACEGAGVLTLPRGLTLHNVSESNETERKADSRKFVIAIMILTIGLLIFSCGVALAIWKPGTTLEQILFPLGASIISPVAVGYFGQKININKSEER